MRRRRRKDLSGRPTEKELELRKLRVICIASQLFADLGYAETALNDVARGSGVATATINQHVGDKEAVFREVIFVHGDAYGPDQSTLDGHTYDRLSLLRRRNGTRRPAGARNNLRGGTCQNYIKARMISCESQPSAALPGNARAKP